MEEKKIIKMYVSSMEDLNEQEKKYNNVSYKRLIERVSNGVWLFNNAPRLANYDFDFEIGTDYDEENEDYKEIYQYYLIDVNSYILEKLQNLSYNNLIIAWSENLEEHVLMVDHFGTGWDCVLTDIEPTTNLDEADI